MDPKYRIPNFEKGAKKMAARTERDALAALTVGCFEVLQASPSLPLYEIRRKGSGQVPDVLKGRWNNIAIANKAIENYIASLKK